MSSIFRGRRRLLLIPAAVGLVVTLGACQPDLMLRVKGSGDPYTGRNVVNQTAVGQVVEQTVPAETKAKYQFNVKNVGSESCATFLDELAVYGVYWERKYLLNGVNVTEAVQNGSQIVALDPGETQTFVLKVLVTAVMTLGEGAPSPQATPVNAQTVKVGAICEAFEAIDVNKAITTNGSAPAP